MRPQTPTGSRTRISPLASVSLSCCSRNEWMKPCKCPIAASAWADRAIETGAPISSIIACARSSSRSSVAALRRSRRSSRMFFGVPKSVSNACLAALTAAFTSLLSARKTVPIFFSVAGLKTGNSCFEEGATQVPPMKNLFRLRMSYLRHVTVPF